MQTDNYFLADTDSAKDVFNELCYPGNGDIPATQTSGSILITQVDHALPNDRLGVRCNDMYGRRLTECFDQKSVRCRMDIVKKSTKDGQLVVDLCYRTFTTATACLKFSIHLCFMVCKIDPIGFNDSVPAIIETFAGKVLNIE